MKRPAAWAFAFIVLLCTTPPALGAGFREDFDGPTLDPAKWIVDPGVGSVTLLDGALKLAGGSGPFPYLTPVSDPIPAGFDYVVRIRARFPVVRQCGNGFGAVGPGITFGAVTGFSYWQDTGGPLRVSVGDLLPVFITPGLDTEFHLFEWFCAGSEIAFHLDGQFKTSDATAVRPVSFFIGHPPGAGCSSWTEQEIDFVEVVVDAPTPSVTASWGRIKGVYR